MNEIDFLAVAVAAVASFGFGALWYSPVLFLQPWSRASGIDPDAQIISPVRVYGLAFVFTLITAAALAVLVAPGSGWGAGLGTGACTGAFVVAASMGINYQFASRSLLFWAIDGGFQVGRFVIMGLILGLWP